jgi:pimeloyl-ACP methyl ester carboxylesterase
MIKTINFQHLPKLSYQITGSGAAIMLLHGFPANMHLWRLVTPELEDYFTVITPNLPACSAESIGSIELSIEMMADAIAAIANAEALPGMVLVAHSMGAYVALALAERYPHLVDGLTIVHSSGLADGPERQEARKRSVDIILNGGKNAFIRQMIPNLFATGFAELHPEMIQDQYAVGMEYPAVNLAALQLAMLKRPDRTTILQQAAFPMQWIFGENDNVIPYKQTLQQVALANFNFVSLYKNCGHMAMLENPVQLSKDILNFSNYCNSHKQLL